jgi:hypothetical protein
MLITDLPMDVLELELCSVLFSENARMVGVCARVCRVFASVSRSEALVKLIIRKTFGCGRATALAFLPGEEPPLVLFRSLMRSRCTLCNQTLVNPTTCRACPCIVRRRDQLARSNLERLFTASTDHVTAASLTVLPRPPLTVVAYTPGLSGSASLSADTFTDFVATLQQVYDLTLRCTTTLDGETLNGAHLVVLCCTEHQVAPGDEQVACLLSFVERGGTAILSGFANWSNR